MLWGTISRSVLAFTSLVLVLLISGCGGGGSETTPTSQSSVPSSVSGLDARPANSTCLAGDSPGVIPTTVEIQRAFDNLSFLTPVALVQDPSDRWYAVEQAGRILSFPDSDSTTTADPFIDIQDRVDSYGQGGLLGMALDPAFINNGYVYLFYTTSDDPINDTVAPVNFRSVISRFTVNNGVLDPASEEQILTIPQTDTTNNGGHIAFGPDDYLYIGLGDGGISGNPNDSQNTTNLLGTILRIDVSTLPYQIPADNPFQGNPLCSNGSGTMDCPEIFAWGFRNPWRGSFDRDPLQGDLWLGDIGPGSWDEANRVELGKNYGWPCYEGNHDYDTNGCLDRSNYSFPVTENAIDHSGATITGGYVYRGSAIPTLTGTYLYAEYDGQIEAVSDPYGSPDLLELSITSSSISSFAEANDGELYILSKDLGKIWRFIAGIGSTTTMPDKLSETGCADPTNPKQATSGMLPYGLNAPLWADNSDTARWFALPDNSQITILPDGNWDFPIGSVLRRDFYLDNKIIETRILMRHTDGGWMGHTYEWDDTETDATLLHMEKTKTIGTQDWTYPSPTQCLRCHTSSAARTLGLETAQLNREYTFAETGRTANQLATYEALGLFTAPLPAEPSNLSELVDSGDTSQPLELRARSYLHVNCAGCHRPGGYGRNAIDMRFNIPFSDMNICNVVPQRDVGVPGATLLTPGNPAMSILSVRMHALPTDGIRMPPMGSNLVDPEGTQLIDNWILSITNCP